MKKNNVDILFNNESQMLFNKIEPYKKSVPDWFRHMPHNALPHINQRYLNGKTAKTCPSIWEYFDNVYMLKWWTDISIEVNGKEISVNPDIGEHTFYKVDAFSPEKYGNYVPDMKNKTILKLHAPFAMLSKKHSKLLCEDVYYAYNKDYRVVPGIVDPYYSNQIIVILELYSNNIQINKGDPAMLYIPLDNQKITNRLAKEKDFNHIKNIQNIFETKFSGGYKDAKNL